MRDVALGWQLWELTHSAVALGLLGAFRVLPILLFAMVGGVAADALDRRRLMLVSQSIMAISSGLLAYVSFSGQATATLLYVFVSFSSLSTAFDNPARHALVTSLVREQDLSSALSLGVLGFHVSTVVGPALGGILLGASSAGVVHLVDAVSFVAVLGSLVVIRPRARLEHVAPVPLRPSAIAPAIAHLRATPVLFWLMIVDFFATFFAGALELMPIFADRIFHVGPMGLGLLVAAPALGAVVASVFVAARRPIRRQGMTVLVSVIAYGASIAVFGLTQSFVFSLVVLALSGAADTVSTVVRQVVRQTLTPDELRGRMTALNMIFFMGGPQLGELEAGVLARYTSASFAVASGGFLCIGVALLFVVLVPSLRHLEAKRL